MPLTHMREPQGGQYGTPEELVPCADLLASGLLHIFLRKILNADKWLSVYSRF